MFTQPLMYKQIRKQKPVLQKYAELLISQGVVNQLEYEVLSLGAWEENCEKNYLFGSDLGVKDVTGPVFVTWRWQSSAGVGRALRPWQRQDWELRLDLWLCQCQTAQEHRVQGLFCDQCGTGQMGLNTSCQFGWQQGCLLGDRDSPG